MSVPSSIATACGATRTSRPRWPHASANTSTSSPLPNLPFFIPPDAMPYTVRTHPTAAATRNGGSPGKPTPPPTLRAAERDAARQAPWRQAIAYARARNAPSARPAPHTAKTRPPDAMPYTVSRPPSPPASPRSTRPGPRHRLARLHPTATRTRRPNPWPASSPNRPTTRQRPAGARIKPPKTQCHTP
jgi:hypothetical protein